MCEMHVLDEILFAISYKTNRTPEYYVTILRMSMKNVLVSNF